MITRQRGFTAAQLIIILVLILTMAATTYFLANRDSMSSSTTTTTTTNSPSPGSNFITLAGEVTSIDLSAMQVDGYGRYDVKEASGMSHTINVSPRETSKCSSEAIAVADNIKVGSTVKVRAETNPLSESDAFYLICVSGTYIKAL